MIKIQKFQSLGEMQGDWLHARYHFSFSMYRNPDRMGFGRLRVLNDDRIKAGRGFAMHPHRDMEIVTYVRKGAVHHRDSLGNSGVTRAGDVQVMSAGTGIVHSEESGAEEDATLFQIWLVPDETGVKPRWEAAQFPAQAVTDALPLLVSGRKADAGKGALFIHSDAAVYGGRLAAGAAITHALSGDAYLVMSRGSAEINGLRLDEGDGAEVTGEASLNIRASQDAELLVIEVGTV